MLARKRVCMFKGISWKIKITAQFAEYEELRAGNTRVQTDKECHIRLISR